MSRLGSQPASSRRIAVPKPKSDVYVALLAISLGALIVACVLLALELNRYQWKVKPPKAAVDPLPGPALAQVLEGADTVEAAHILVPAIPLA